MFAEVSKESNEVSSYQPNDDVIACTKDFSKAFGKGIDILHHSDEELNYYSPIARENKDQRTFNSFVDEDVDDPMEAWKWRGTRSMARDKALEMHAHGTAQLAIPMAMAQNDKQEEDRQMSYAMRDTIEWVATNSEYKESYVNLMMGILYSPAKWLGVEWVESYITQKYQDDDDSWQSRQVLDQELSGPRFPIYSIDQVLISNTYEQNVQRQYIIIKREYKPRTDMERLWSWHPNWDYVQDGIKSVYSEEDGLFYDSKDEAHKGLVEHAVGYCRQTDTEVTFLNGIYMGDDDVDINAIRHRDNFNQAKVPLVAFGYERINEHYFYYKSLMNRVGWDNALLDAMYENQMNREAIDLYTPLAMYGVEEFNTSAIFPGAVVSFENPEAKAEALLPPGRGEGYRAMREAENSIRDKTVSDVMGGQEPDATQKAYNVARAEQNARTILKGALRSVSFSVARTGDLIKDMIIQHLSTAQWDEITGGETYRTLLLKDQMVDGKQVSKQVIFDDSLVGHRMSEEEKKDAELVLLSKTGWPKNKNHIYHVNPHIFSKLKYLITIEPEAMLEKNKAFEKAMVERMYGLLRNDPLVDPEGLVRKVLNANFESEAEDLISKQQQELPGTDIKSPNVQLNQTTQISQPEPG